MNKKYLQLILLLAVITMTSLAFAYDNGDFQAWHTANITWKIGDDWKLAIEREMRFGDSADDFSYHHTDIGTSYSGFADWFVLGLNFRNVNEDNGEEWLMTHQPHLNATFKAVIKDFKLSNRIRMEYRDRQDASDGFRMRNKITLKFPIKFTKKNIQPYLADEIFVDFDQGGMNRNRLYAGFVFDIVDNLKGELFYLLQSSESNNKWNDYNVLGTKLKLSF